MALRCLLFSADEASAAPIRQVLAGLGVEGEHCSEAVSAVEKVTRESYQIVIIDWDKQPEAGLLLTAARERKASERPLTLALVSDDASVPQALQAGANSILRKPVLVNQIKDTLTTARDLLRAKQESAANAAQAAAAGASAGTVSGLPSSTGDERTLRAGEFLQSSSPTPGGQFVVEAPHPEWEPAAEPIDPLKELEPMAAAVKPALSEPTPAPAPAPLPAPPAAAPSSDEPRGLEWYLKRAGALPPNPGHAPATPPQRPESKPELMGFDQPPSSPSPPQEVPANAPETQEQEQKAEERLFSYMDGEGAEPKEGSRLRFRLGKGPMIVALVLAACAIVAAPQAPWHGRVGAVWASGRRSVHGWLNPQPVTTAQAPESHESFRQPGEEYKLPVAETIPDATTDPSQIRVIPVIDPTAKKPNNAGTNGDAAPNQGDGTAATGNDPGAQVPAGQTPANPSSATQPADQPVQADDGVAPAGGSNTAGTTQPATSPAQSAPAEQLHANPATVPSSLLVPPPAQPAAVQSPEPHPVTTPTYVSAPTKVPSSLKSQMASMTPEASGNKAPEAALPSIEPVAVPEAAERALMATQPAIAYPANAKGQQGTVVLQVLIGRDGTVQDAKFLQGSLAFARTAIDGVKQWTFKPYVMNGRAVSVQTSLTMTFKPGQ